MPEKNPFPVPNVWGGDAFTYMGKIILTVTKDPGRGIYEYDEPNDTWTRLPGDISTEFNDEFRAVLTDNVPINC